MLSASEIYELEKKVFQYRLKKNLQKIGILFVLLIFFGVGLIVSMNLLKPSNQEIPLTANVVTEKNTSVMPIAKEDNISALTNVVPIPEAPQKIEPTQNQATVIVEETLMLKSPTVNTGKETRTNNTYLAPPKYEDQKPYASFKEQEIEKSRKNSFDNDDIFYRASDEKIDTTVLAPPLLEESKPKSVIKIETQEVNSIQYLKDKFEKTNNIIFALMLAEEFYNNKNYVESNKWALIANHLDSDNEKSWIWFAKSKLKLGQKEDAIVALKAYLKTNKSKMAQTLLNQISMGEINE